VEARSPKAKLPDTERDSRANWSLILTKKKASTSGVANLELIKKAYKSNSLNKLKIF